MKYFLTGFILLIFSGAFSQHQVGHFNTTYQDPSRGNRNIETEVYYPATTAGDNTPMASGQFPVVVFGHGFVMVWSAYQNLWEEFVPNGYIMVFPRTEGSLLSTDHQEFGWDLQFLVNKIQEEGANNPASPIYNGVANNTALMGHSMGGGASFLAADSLCENGNTNLKTLIGLAPAESSTNGVSSINSALSVTVPSLVLSGSQDGVTPPNDHHIPMYDSLASSCKTFISITGGAHCYFANSNFNCDFGESTASSGISITRQEQHAVTFDFVNLWLDYTLKDSCDALTAFQDSLASSNRITHNQSCNLNPTPSVSESSGVLTSSQTGVGYQWYLDNTIIPGANAVSYSPTSGGYYTVQVLFASGCPSISAPYLYSLASLPEQSSFEKQISLYPNATSGKFTLQLNQTYSNIAVRIQTLDGKTLFVKNYHSVSSIPLELEGSYGTYLLEISNSKGESAIFRVFKK